MEMKAIRKWARKWHRILGFFFVGMSIIYGVSGIAINHLKDWNPNYSVQIRNYTPTYDFTNKSTVGQNITLFLKEIKQEKNYKTYAYLSNNRLKIYLKSGSSVTINLADNSAELELLKKRFMFYQFNFLHYNPHVWWKWFSDFFAISLIFFALSSLVMVRGKNGLKGSGGIYVAVGIIIPIILYFV